MVDECVYHKFSGRKHIFLVLYFNDILFATNDDVTQPGSHSRLSNRWPRRAPQRTSLKFNSSKKAKLRSEPFLIILLNLSFWTL